MTRCPLCSGPPGKSAFPNATRFRGRIFRFHACSACGTRFIDPLPDREMLAAFYAPEVYHDHFYAESASDRHGAMIALLRSHLPSGARVLDYGCGNGDFLIAAQAAGFDAAGAEYGSAAAAAERRTGCRVIDLIESDGLLPGGWGAIHLSDVLEHLVDPGAAATGLVEALNPGGLLAIAGPLDVGASLVAWTARSFDRIKRLRSGERVAGFVPWHLFLTNAPAQRAFFRRFRLVEEHWAVWEDGWPYLDNGRFRHAVARLALVAARLPLLRGRLGNRFRAVYRKPA